MMSAASESEERVAEILREILALSGTKRLNHSKPATADDPIKLVDPQCVNELQASAPCGKQVSEKRSKPKDHDSLCQKDPADVCQD
jgi:hypothetical protein